MLGRVLLRVRHLFLLLGLREDELQHGHGAIAALALGLEVIVPSRRRRRVVALLLQEGVLELLREPLVVGLQHADGALEQSFRLDQAADVPLVGEVVDRTVLGPGDLVLVVLRLGLIGLEDGNLEASLRILDGRCDRIDLRLQGVELAVLHGDVAVRLLALRVAPRLLLVVGYLLLLDQGDHLADLLQDGRERVVGLQHGDDAAQKRAALGAAALLQESHGLGPGRYLRGLRRGSARAVPVHGRELDELGAGGTGGRGCDLAKGLEGLVAVEDGDALRDGRLLAGPQAHALLVLCLLIRAHVHQLHHEVLGLCERGLRVRELRLLVAENAVVAAEQALLQLVRLAHLVESLLHGRHIRRVRGRGLLLGLAGRLQVCREGVTHLLEDADDLTRLRAVGAGEGRLDERVHGLRLLVAGEGEGCQHRLPDGGLHRRKVGLVARHVLPMVGRGVHSLVGADRRQHVDGLLHLADGLHQICLRGDELLVLLVADGLPLRAGRRVRRHVLVQPGRLLAQLAAGGLQLLDGAAEQADLLLQHIDLLGLGRLVGVAIALVLAVQFALGVALRLRPLQQVLEQLDDLGDGAILGLRLAVLVALLRALAQRDRRRARGAREQQQAADRGAHGHHHDPCLKGCRATVALQWDGTQAKARA
mmetsp:Transcript_23191/g.59069  ORF Transcript_23191/g.59069 Transcript_23191/m.59069 type:complete len:649 (+) Transcript_23191:620-2566(+)